MANKAAGWAVGTSAALTGDVSKVTTQKLSTYFNEGKSKVKLEKLKW